MVENRRIHLPAPAPGEPKVRIECFGSHCAIYAGELLIGKGVKRVEFQQEAQKPAILKIECDVEQLGFSILEHKESALNGSVSEAKGE